MTYTAIELTANETQALEALRSNSEGVVSIDGDRQWASVYLDNAKPFSWSGKTWSGVLSSLSKKGLYQDDDGYAFGLVLLSI